MYYLRVEFLFSTLFSLKTINSGSTFAKASPLPSPTTIKMAVISAAFRHGGPREAEKVFNDLIEAEIYLKATTMHRSGGFRRKLVPSKESKNFNHSYGYREVLRPEGPIQFVIKSKRIKRIKQYLKCVRYLGDSHSLGTVICVETLKSEPKDFLRPMDSVQEGLDAYKKDYLGRKVVELRDFKKTLVLEDLNVFSNTKSSGKILVKKYYFPVAAALPIW